MSSSSSRSSGKNDPRGSPETLIFQHTKDTLIEIRSQLLYGQDLRTLEKGYIDIIERDLRNIIRQTEKLRTAPNLHEYVDSIEGFQSSLRKAISKLYIASDVLASGRKINERKLFYDLILECSRFLYEALDHIRI